MPLSYWKKWLPGIGQTELYISNSAALKRVEYFSFPVIYFLYEKMLENAQIFLMVLPVSTGVEMRNLFSPVLHRLFLTPFSGQTAKIF
jgi:hypothetical protein